MDSHKDELPRRDLMSSLNSLLTLTSPAVKKLLGFKHSEEEERYARKAVDILYKKLKKNRSAIEELERALTCPGTPSKCVTIKNSFDGRIQVCYRKGLAHVVYCRIWRWPDLQSHRELKPIRACQYPFSFTNIEICINPYHYERVDSNIKSKDLVPEYGNTLLNSLHPLQQTVEPTISNNTSYTQNGFNGTRISLSSESNDSSSGSTTPNHPEYTCGSSVERLSPAGSSSESLSDTNINSNEVQQIVYQEQPSWSSISYYELNNRVGEMFRVNSNSVIVDGFTNPNPASNRFCLGRLSNVNRNSTIENTRKHIGKGVHLYYANGEVYVDCLSESAIFVHSRIVNYQQNYPLSTVNKITHGCSMRVFSNVQFAELLSECVNHGYEAVYDLTQMCTIRISFVKGWGVNYHRPDITSTPCWIEIHLHNPLKWLDKVLIQMGGPNSSINSVS